MELEFVMYSIFVLYLQLLDMEQQAIYKNNVYMNKIILNAALLILLFSAACNNDAKRQELSAAVNIPSVLSQPMDSIVYESENLTIRKVGDHVYQHISFLNTESFGKVPCNGMIVANDKEAIVFDTPTDDKSSAELIKYFAENRALDIIAVVSTHFHLDCVGGLDKFHEHQIPSYANNQTISLLKSKNSESSVPQNGFDSLLELRLGDKAVYAEYFGEGHTKDNVIGYFPEEKVIFGGCLIKETGAGKGNLEDANIKAWPETVKKIKAKYPNTKIIIPGHGQLGGTELLDYTIKLFE